MKRSYDQIIIGGGIIGCSIAYHLSKRGKRVLVLEADQLASGASKAAAGMLGVQMEFTEYSPFFQFAQESREMHAFLAESLYKQTGINVHYMKKGAIKLAFHDQGLAELQEVASFQQQAGLYAELVSPSELSKLEPQVDIDGIVGAMYCPEEAHVSAPHLTWAFAKAAVHHGSVILERCKVNSLLIENERIVGVETIKGNYFADQVVLATGASLLKFSNYLPDQLSVTPVKGECIALKSEQSILDTTIFSERCYIVSKNSPYIFIGATVKENVENVEVSAGSIHDLLEQAFRIIPELRTASISHVWAGLRPKPGRKEPYLGEVPEQKGLYVAAGHYRNGILLAPMTGVYMADLLEGKAVSSYYKQAFSLQNQYQVVKEEFH